MKIKFFKDFVITFFIIIPLVFCVVYKLSQDSIKRKIRDAAVYMTTQTAMLGAAGFNGQPVQVYCDHQCLDKIKNKEVANESPHSQAQEVPSQEELFNRFQQYYEACHNQDMKTFLKIVSTDKINQLQQKFKESGSLLSKENLCSDRWKNGADLNELRKQDIVDSRANDLYARLVLWSKTKDPTYHGLETYIFYKKENGYWKFLDYEQVYAFEVQKTPFDERDISHAYQLKRHKFRFLDDDLRVTASVSREELQAILKAVKERAKFKVVWVDRATYPSDVVVPVEIDSKNHAVRMRQVNPDEDDVIVEVTTKNPSTGYGSGFGEIYRFEKVDCCWKLVEGSTWVE